MRYRPWEDQFSVEYDRFQDNDNEWANTATVTLFEDMGDSGSGVILIGTFGPGPEHLGELSNRTLRYVP